MKLKPILEFNNNHEFFSGTRFRVYGIGLNVNDPKDDYYEYMLAEVPGERDYMLATCVEGSKSGNALAFVKTKKETNKFCVTTKDLKFSVGSENVFVIIKN